MTYNMKVLHKHTHKKVVVAIKTESFKSQSQQILGLLFKLWLPFEKPYQSLAGTDEYFIVNQWVYTNNY